MPSKQLKAAENEPQKDRVTITISTLDKKRLQYIMLDLDLHSPSEVITHLLNSYDRKTGRMKEQKPESGATIIEVP
jgi:hypothetical protein